LLVLVAVNETNFTGKLICNSPNHIRSGNFDSEIVAQDEIFYYKDIFHFLGADYMDRASPVNRAEKCHENLPWAAK
jgi:hypothetical protein